MMHIILLINQKDYEPFIIAHLKNVEIQKTEVRRQKPGGQRVAPPIIYSLRMLRFIR